MACYDANGIETSCEGTDCEFGDCTGQTNTFVEQTFGEAVSPFLQPTTDWMGLENPAYPLDEFQAEYGMYFQPYDATKEIYARDMASLKEQSAMQTAETNMRTVETITGASGFASSYQPRAGEESVWSAAQSDMASIRTAKSQEIYSARKEYMEDFYDTIKDLAALEAFEYNPPSESSYDDVGDYDPVLPDEDILEDIMNEANCSEAGGTLNVVTGECEGAMGGGGSDSVCCCGPDHFYSDQPCHDCGLCDEIIITPGISDARLKENILQIGTRDGINLYEFEYIDKKWGEGRYRGVMAQDLLQTSYRNAVHLNDDGYMLVDYSKLPVDMEKV